MDREIWKTVLQAIRRAARAVEDPGRTPRYPHWLIVAMYLWSVWHDRCLNWACDQDHYGKLFRPRQLPSRSQFCRRIASDICQAILQRVHEELLKGGINCDVLYLDGKALPVSPVSKDKHARNGIAGGAYAKGYKLHAYVNARRRIVLWSVMPLNVDEKLVAWELAWHLPPLPPNPLLMGDTNYDAARLHKVLEHREARLLTPLKQQERVGPEGHHPVTLRQMGAARREAVKLWQEHPLLARYVLKERIHVEQVFSVLTCACHLSLPPAVRRLDRVRRWVGAKILLYHARLLVQEAAQGTAS